MQHCYLPLRYVWKITIVQKVCEVFDVLFVPLSSFIFFCLTFLSFLENYLIKLVLVAHLSIPTFICGIRAFVFFSSPVTRELVSHIKKDGSVLSRIGALREVTLTIYFLFFFPLHFVLQALYHRFRFWSLFSYRIWNLQMNLEYFAIDSQVCNPSDSCGILFLCLRRKDIYIFVE